MFVARARFEHVARKLQYTEQKLAEKDAANERLIAQLQHHRDEYPDSPVAVQPAVGDARALQLLALSEGARRDLDARCLELHRVNVLQEHEIAQLQQQLAQLQAAAEGVAS